MQVSYGVLSAPIHYVYLAHVSVVGATALMADLPTETFTALTLFHKAVVCEIAAR